MNTRMTTYDVVPPRLAQVLFEGEWRDAYLRAWRRVDGRWRGFVTYSVGVGMNRLGWFDEDQLRRDENGST